MDLVDDHRPRGLEHGAARSPSRAGCRATPAWSRRYAAEASPRAGARPAACRQCAPRTGSRRRAGPARARPRGCRRAASRDCGGCRSRAPLAARHRRSASRPSAHRRAPGARGRRWHRGKRRASCRSQSAPRSAHRGPRQSPATRQFEPASAQSKLWSNHARTAGWKKSSCIKRPAKLRDWAPSRSISGKVSFWPFNPTSGLVQHAWASHITMSALGH